MELLLIEDEQFMVAAWGLTPQLTQLLNVTYLSRIEPVIS